jgi:hypothetical protein
MSSSTFRTIPISSQRLSKNSSDQELVSEQWKILQSSMEIDKAVQAFLTQKIDDCGQTIAFEAFQLVQQKLNPKGFVRKSHKGSDSSLGSAIKKSENPWSQAGLDTMNQWDWNNSWCNGKDKWKNIDNNIPLSMELVKDFCERATEGLVYRELPGVITLTRDMPARYSSVPPYRDTEDSVPAVETFSTNQPDTRLKLRSSIPDDLTNVVLRWETICTTLDSAGNPATKNLESYWKFCMRLGKSDDEARDQRVNTAPLANIQDIPTDAVLDNASFTVRDIKRLLLKFGIRHDPKNGKLKAFWINVLKRLRNETVAQVLAGSNGNIKPIFGKFNPNITGLLERPDLILEIGYFNEKTGLFQKRIVIVEVDGDDKTLNTKTQHPLKLALKLMSSTNAQIPVNDNETYHIRSNFWKYKESVIEKSLMQTTDITLPEFADIVKQYQKPTPGSVSRDNDYRNFHHSIHLVHHLFKAHVKIAFMIHMKVMHNINMCGDDDEAHMSNQSFFVNFPGHDLPENLCFEDELPPYQREWLQQRLMLHTRPKIKYWNVQKQSSDWTDAPLMNASSNHAQMKSWTAGIRKGSLPPFPHEVPDTIPVSIVRIQRVQMQELIRYVKVAAERAEEMYRNAYELKSRDTFSNPLFRVIPRMVKTTRRQFPDRFFFTRKEQLQRDRLWNIYTSQNSFLLRFRQTLSTQDHVEHNWGYERPSIKRNPFVHTTPDGSTITDWEAAEYGCWDQIDVRIHFFHMAMREKESEWKKFANGMWYLQDYIVFFKMLQKLTVPDITMDDRLTECASSLTPAIKHAIYPYVIQVQKALDNTLYEVQHAQHLSDYYYDGTPTQCMPTVTQQENAACLKFSVLSYFFDCRDDGACRYAWENELLKYFSSSFTNFHFAPQVPNSCEYFNNMWFQMTFFLELNFRNAIAPLHFKLFDFDKSQSGDKWQSISELQTRAKNLFNRQRTLLNTRELCVGPREVTPGLWFLQQKQNGYHQTCVLKNLILSQLHDELPALDPHLMAYVRRERIPGAELFLRMIACPNVLALREFAVQHRYLLDNGSPPAGVPLKSRVQNTLRHFPDSIQTEILYLLKKVQTDDSIFSVMPVVHPSKLVLLCVSELTQLVRKVLDVHGHKTSFKTPLQMKFYMFTRDAEFRVFRQLFCTENTLEHAYSCRPLVFVLMKICMALTIMKNEHVAVAVPQLESYYGCHNEAVELLELNTLKPNAQYEFDITVHERNTPVTKKVPCIIGTSRSTWPNRDQNKIHKKKTLIASDETRNADVYGLLLTNKITPTCILLTEEEDSMTDEEREKWMLLMYARPTAGQSGEYRDVMYDDGVVVRQPAENPSTFNRDKQHRDTMIVGVRNAHSLDPNACELYDVPDTEIFFEKFEATAGPNQPSVEYFPDYITDIIPEIPDRTLIYVPAVFATKLRTAGPIHDKLYQHDECLWRMSCVGYRAWAWKRLLVKCIFFDAWTKVMTRAMSLLALYKPLDDSCCKQVGQAILDPEFKDTFKTLKILMKATNNVLGDMEFTQGKLGPLHHNSLRPKTFQALLTIHKKKHKNWRMLDLPEQVRTSDELMKLSRLDRQLIWFQYLLDNWEKLKNSQTTRFLKLDPGIYSCLKDRADRLGQISTTSCVASDVLIRGDYGDYLHLTKSQNCLVVLFQNNYYIKFPKDFAVLKINNDVGCKIGCQQKSDTDFYFATLFDCRKYSVSIPEGVGARGHLKKAYSQENRILLRNLGHEFIHLHDGWHPTQGNSSNEWGFLADTSGHPRPRRPNLQFLITAQPRPFIDDLFATSLQRQHMYTLPDLYSELLNKPGAIIIAQVDGHGEPTNDKFYHALMSAASQPEKRYILWNELRASTHFIQTVEKQGNAPNKILKGTGAIRDEYLRALVDRINTLLNV